MKQILPCLLLLFALQAAAQWRYQPHYLEAGVMLGVTSYSGDITAKQIDPQEIRPGYGAFVRYHLDKNFAVRGHVYGGAISGDDKYSDIKAPRSFKFGTSILEVAAAFEWHLFGRDRLTETGLRHFFITPYFFGGVGATFADATVEYYGPPERRADFLKVPIPEEGLKSTFLLAPAGGGIRVDFYERFIFGLEGSFRPVFSDDIDGVSKNGNPDRKDWYYFLGATVSFVLNGSDY